MKVRREVRDTIELEDGLVVVLDFSPLSQDIVRVEVATTADSGSANLLTDPEIVERVAAVIAKRRRDNDDRREVCPDHGWQTRICEASAPGVLKCVECVKLGLASDSVDRLKEHDEVK